jgi:hypothetical protein
MLQRLCKIIEDRHTRRVFKIIQAVEIDNLDKRCPAAPDWLAPVIAFFLEEEETRCYIA